MTLRIMQIEPPAYVLETEPGTTPRRVARCRERASVLNQDMQGLALDTDVDAKLEAVLATPMLE